MILDHFKNIEQYVTANSDLQQVIHVLKNMDLAGVDPGRYEVPGTEAFFMFQKYETKPVLEGVWEAHRKYIDLQYIVSGIELIGYKEISELQITRAYDAESDAVFYNGEGNFITMYSGMFMVLYPQDGHMPGINTGGASRVIKVVAKLPV